MAAEFVRIEGLAAAIRTFAALEPAFTGKSGGPVLFALRRGAKLIQAQVKANIRQIVLEPNKGGLPSKSTGFLEKNIAVKRSRPPPGQKGERVLIYVRAKGYPYNGKGRGPSAPQISRLLEGGDVKMVPHPHWRPAFDSKKQEALAVFVSSFSSRLAAIVKKVERENGALQ